MLIPLKNQYWRNDVMLEKGLAGPLQPPSLQIVPDINTVSVFLLLAYWRRDQ